METLDYQRVKEQMLDMNYKWFEGIMDPNLVFFRTSQEYTNTMTDVATLSYVDKFGQEMFIEIPCSTKPALWGKGSVMDPNTIDGITGVGVIAAGQHLGAWKMMNFSLLVNGEDAFAGNPHYAPSLWQCGKFKVYRDGNLDMKINKEITMDSLGQGFNMHYAGQDLSFKNSPYLPWSTGCFTAIPRDMNNFLSMMNDTIPFNGRIISPTIIEL